MQYNKVLAGTMLTVAAMEYVDKLVKNGMPAASTMAENTNDVLFESGKIAMLPLGSWMVAPMKGNVSMEAAL